MQQTNSKDNDNELSRARRIPASQILPDTEADAMTYEQLCACVTSFFESKEYECYESYKQGYSKSVSEDYRNIDLLTNLNDLTYNYCSGKNMSSEQKVNFKNLCKGIQMLTRSMKQYDTNDVDKVYIAHLAGYVLKVIRNFYHD